MLVSRALITALICGISSVHSNSNSYGDSKTVGKRDRERQREREIARQKNDNEKSEIKAQQQRQQHRQTAEWQTKQNSTAKSKELNNCFETGSRVWGEGGGNSVGATTYISNSSCCSCCWLAGVTTSTDSGAQCAIIHYQQLGILKCSKAAETTQEANKNTAKKRRVNTERK